MLDKIRLHFRGKLPDDYNLGHGLEDLRQRIRNHIAWAGEAAAAIASLDGLRLTTDCRLSLFTFQYAPRASVPTTPPSACSARSTMTAGST